MAEVEDDAGGDTHVVLCSREPVRMRETRQQVCLRNVLLRMSSDRTLCSWSGRWESNPTPIAWKLLNVLRFFSRLWNTLEHN